MSNARGVPSGGRPGSVRDRHCGRRPRPLFRVRGNAFSRCGKESHFFRASIRHGSHSPSRRPLYRTCATAIPRRRGLIVRPEFRTIVFTVLTDSPRPAPAATPLCIDSCRNSLRHFSAPPWHVPCLSVREPAPRKTGLGALEPGGGTHQVFLMKKTWIALIGFLAIVTFFLWEEHRAHILGALPWALLLLCPLLHFSMHRGRGGHGGRRSHERDGVPHGGHDGTGSPPKRAMHGRRTEMRVPSGQRMPGSRPFPVCGEVRWR